MQISTTRNFCVEGVGKICVTVTVKNIPKYRVEEEWGDEIRPFCVKETQGEIDAREMMQKWISAFSFNLIRKEKSRSISKFLNFWIARPF